MILGASANTIEEVERVKVVEPDYWGTQVFPSPKRPGGQAVGMKGLRLVKKAVGNDPVIGIGNVNESNAASILEIVDGIAVIRAVLDADDPGYATQELVEIVSKSRMK